MEAWSRALRRGLSTSSASPGGALARLRARLAEEDADLDRFAYAVEAPPMKSRTKKPSWLTRPPVPGGAAYAQIQAEAA
eukprot:jgi/Pico_ML_1/53173/g3772.t1